MSDLGLKMPIRMELYMENIYNKIFFCDSFGYLSLRLRVNWVTVGALNNEFS